MKKLIPIILLVAVALSGCVSSVAPDNADRISSVVRPVGKNLSIGILANNPDKVDAMLALAAAADAAILGTDLTPANIKAFVDTFAARWNLTDNQRLYVAAAIDDLATLYKDAYGTKVISALDPNVVKYLKAFSAGIRSGVEFHRAITGGVP